MLRKLKEKDAPFMLEWMMDEDINKFFHFSKQNISLENALNFIKTAQDMSVNRHYAVVDEKDEYLGTISLKNISLEDHNAEYAVCFRKKSIGSGISRNATEELLRIAFDELKLHKVYLNVLSDNIRAIKFYEKMGFIFEGEFIDHVCIDGEYKNLKWYAIRNEGK